MDYPLLPPDALIPFESTSGPRTAKIALVGEAWGKSEALIGLPFMGYSGQELTRLLADAGIQRSQCFLTNVFPFQPAADNKIEALCGPKAMVGKDYKLPPLSAGKYILSDYLPCLERLREELETVRPNLVIALGNTASWALMNQTAISRIRGTVAESTLIPGLKVLPTFHPASVLRNWAQRPIVFADFIKAKREADWPEIRTVHRQVLIDPHIHELWDWFRYLSPSAMLGCDIETKDGQITMISFADSPTRGVVVPFIRPKAKWAQGVSYWPTLALELEAWHFVKTVLAGPQAKVWQNGMYDLQYLAMMGFRVMNCTDDTMLLHHSLYPELPKSLGFLGSIYTNERSWKQLRTAKDEEKKDA
jgi:uracil-DNA glycosylase